MYIGFTRHLIFIRRLTQFRKVLLVYIHIYSVYLCFSLIPYQKFVALQTCTNNQCNYLHVAHHEVAKLNTCSKHLLVYISLVHTQTAPAIFQLF